jgi:hypothetical protein
MLTMPPPPFVHTLQSRFEAHPTRHRGISWADVLTRLEGHPDALDVLHRMEESGGEPDVIGGEQGRIVFCDCSAESPLGRRGLCFDGAALEARKEAKPSGSAVEMAAALGVALLTEEQYHALQALGDFDLKTSSWVQTPTALRAKGGALFGDKRYGRTFIYHNGAQSYYAARGFRGRVLV